MSTFVDGYRGADVADSIVAHSPRGTVHALRPAADHYLVAVADDVLSVPAVTLARRLVGATDERGRWVVPAHLAPALVEAIQSAADGDPTDLLALTVRETNCTTEKKENNHVY